MKVILLKDVKNLGKKDEVKEVKSGYAYNMLLPNKLAKEASDSELKKLENKKQEEFNKEKENQEIQNSIVDKLNNKTFEIKVPANEKGHMFSKLHMDDLIKIIEIPEARDMIDLPEIKDLGTYEITVNSDEKEGNFKLELK